jgi:phage-related protein
MSQVTIEIILRAIDEASEAVSSMSRLVESSMESIEQANVQVEKATRAVDVSFKDLTFRMNNLVALGFGLYNTIDRIEKAQYAVEKANYAVQAALKSVEDAQHRYNAAVEKYGEDSVQAQAAARELELAQEKYRLAVERAEIVQGNFNQTMFQTALAVFPQAISIVTTASTVFGQLQGAIGAVSGALNFLAANPIVLVIAAIAALVSALIYLYNTNENFRKTVNALAQALQNILKPIIDWLIGAFNTLKNAFEAVAKPIMGFVEGIKGAMSGATNAISNFINRICFAHAIHDAVESAERDLNRFVKVVDESMRTAYGEIRGFGVDLSGIAVPAYPPAAATPVTVHISAPLVNVEGSMDRRLAEETARLVEQKLRTVLIEATSSAAPTKRIRLSGVI